MDTYTAAYVAHLPSVGSVPLLLTTLATSTVGWWSSVGASAVSSCVTGVAFVASLPWSALSRIGARLGAGRAQPLVAALMAAPTVLLIQNGANKKAKESPDPVVDTYDVAVGNADRMLPSVIALVVILFALNVALLWAVTHKSSDKKMAEVSWQKGWQAGWQAGWKERNNGTISKGKPNHAEDDNIPDTPETGGGTRRKYPKAKSPSDARHRSPMLKKSPSLLKKIP